MKTWNAPEVQELNINETADGYFDVDWEGPFDFLFKKSDDSSTPDTEDASK